MANIKRNLAYNFLLSCSQVVLPLVSIPYVSRILDPEGIGRVGFIDSFTWYFVTIAEVGIMVYGIREVAKVKYHEQQLGVLVSELLTLHIISSLCTLVLYAAGVIVLWDKIGDIRLLLFSVSFFLVNFFACDWYFIGREKFRFITMRSLIVRLLALASIFLLIKQPEDYYIYYAIITGSSIVGFLWNLVIVFREVRVSFYKVNWKRHLPYVWVTYLISLFYSVPLMLDNVMLRLVSTASAVGIYAFSVKIVRTGVTLLTDSFLVFFPRIVSLANANEHEQLRQKLLLNIQFVILLSIPMGMGLYLIADELTIVFFGDKFLPIADNLRLLSAYPFLKGVSLFFSNPVLIAHHHEKAFLKNLVGGSLLFVAMALILGHYYSDSGMCMAMLITELFMILANYIAVRRKLPLLPVFDWKMLGQAVLASALFIPYIYIIRQGIDSSGWRLIAGVTGCFMIYGLFLLIVRNSFVWKVKSIISGYVLKK